MQGSHSWVLSPKYATYEAQVCAMLRCEGMEKPVISMRDDDHPEQPTSALRNRRHHSAS